MEWEELWHIVADTKGLFERLECNQDYWEPEECWNVRDIKGETERET